jgi:hypothetical protein
MRKIQKGWPDPKQKPRSIAIVYEIKNLIILLIPFVLNRQTWHAFCLIGFSAFYRCRVGSAR